MGLVWEGKLQSGKGCRCCFGDVHVCVQPRMGIFLLLEMFLCSYGADKIALLLSCAAGCDE